MRTVSDTPPQVNHVPHFMDVHTNTAGATLADIEQAHIRDVEAQARHGVTYHHFFHNEETGQVFCLAEGPSAEACQAVHVEANGMRAEAIIPVEAALIEGFMGGGSVTASGVAVTPDGDTDTGLRAILFTDIVGSTRLTAELGDAAGFDLVAAHDRVLEESLTANEGRRVKHTGDGLLASFISAESAVRCAMAAQRQLSSYRAGPEALPLHVRVGIHAGEPVRAHGDLFGLAVNTASRICDAAGEDGILVSDLVRDLIDGSQIELASRGLMVLKGLPDPVGVHAVPW